MYINKRISRLSPALDFMKNNPGSMPSMTDMARLCELSDSYFSRLFHKEMGLSFVHYLNAHKVQIAKDILSDDDIISIRELSDRLGFTDVSYFIRIFKQITGTTPYSYRKSLKLGR